MSEHDERGRYLLKHYTHVDELDKHCGYFETQYECGEAAIELHKQSKWKDISLTAVQGDMLGKVPIFYACVGNPGCSMEVDKDTLFYPDWYEHYLVVDLVVWELHYGRPHGSNPDDLD